jgi:hypothetical protein
LNLPGAHVPDVPLAFIKECIFSGRVRWTYHVTMRLQHRGLTAEIVRRAIATLEIIETYTEDKYLPSFLVRGESEGIVFHAQIATGVEGEYPDRYGVRSPP